MRVQERKHRSWKQNLALLFCFALLLQLTPFGAFAWAPTSGEYSAAAGGDYLLASDVFSDTISYKLVQGSLNTSWNTGSPPSGITMDKDGFVVTANFDVPTQNQLVYDRDAAYTGGNDTLGDALDAKLTAGDYIENGDVVVFPLAEGLYLASNLTGDIFAEEGGSSIKIGTYKITNTTASTDPVKDNKIVAVLTFDDGVTGDATDPNNVFGANSAYVRAEATFTGTFAGSNLSWSDKVVVGGEVIGVNEAEYDIVKTAGTPALVGTNYEVEWTVTITGKPATKISPLNGYTFSDTLSAGQTYVASSFSVVTSNSSGSSNSAVTVPTATGLALTYAFGAGDNTSAVVTFKTSVPASSLTGVPKANSDKWAFPIANTAELKQDDKVVASDEGTANVEIDMLDKTGVRVATGGLQQKEKMLWTVTVNPNKVNMTGPAVLNDLLSGRTQYPRYAVLVNETFAGTVNATNINTISTSTTGVVGVVAFSTGTDYAIASQSSLAGSDWVARGSGTSFDFDLGAAVGGDLGAHIYTLYYLTETNNLFTTELPVDAINVKNTATLNGTTVAEFEYPLYATSFSKGVMNTPGWVRPEEGGSTFSGNLVSIPSGGYGVPAVQWRLTVNHTGWDVASVPKVMIYDLLVHGDEGYFEDMTIEANQTAAALAVMDWTIGTIIDGAGHTGIAIGTTKIGGLPQVTTTRGSIVPSNFMRYVTGSIGFTAPPTSPSTKNETGVSYSVYKVYNGSEYVADLVVIETTANTQPHAAVQFKAEITNPDIIITNGDKTVTNTDTGTVYNDVSGRVRNYGIWYYDHSTMKAKYALRYAYIRSEMLKKSAVAIDGAFDWTTFAANPMAAALAEDDGSNGYNYVDNSAIFRLDVNKNKVDIHGLVDKDAAATVTEVTITDTLPTGWEFRTYEEDSTKADASGAVTIDKDNFEDYMAIYLTSSTKVTAGTFDTYFSGGEIDGDTLTLTYQNTKAAQIVSLAIFYKAGPTAATLAADYDETHAVLTPTVPNKAKLTVTFDGSPETTATVEDEQIVLSSYNILTKTGERLDDVDASLGGTTTGVASIKWTMDYMPQAGNSPATKEFGARLVDKIPDGVVLITTGDGSVGNPILPDLAYIQLFKLKLLPDGSYAKDGSALSLTAVEEVHTYFEAGEVSYNPTTRELIVDLPTGDGTVAYRLEVITPVSDTGNLENEVALQDADGDVHTAAVIVEVSSASASALLKTGASFTVLKKDKTTNAAMAGVVFRLETVTGRVLQTATTKADGTLMFGLLPEGTFHLVEETPASYKPVTTPFVITVSSGKMVAMAGGGAPATTPEFTILNVLADAGYLVLKKTVSGAASTSTAFDFTVTLHHTSAFAVDYTDPTGSHTSASATDHSIDVTLKATETATFNDLPKDATYTVTETGIGSHTVTAFVKDVQQNASAFVVAGSDAALDNGIAIGNGATEVRFNNHIAAPVGPTDPGDPDPTPTPDVTPDVTPEVTPTDPTPTPTDTDGGTTTTPGGETTTTPAPTVPPGIPGGGGGGIVPFEKDDGEVIFVQLDEDGTPLGKWVQNEDGEWELLELLEDEIPRGAFLPKTGSMLITGIFIAGAAMTAGGLILGRKRKEEDEENADAE